MPQALSDTICFVLVAPPAQTHRVHLRWCRVFNPYEHMHISRLGWQQQHLCKVGERGGGLYTSSHILPLEKWTVAELISFTRLPYFLIVPPMPNTSGIWELVQLRQQCAWLWGEVRQDMDSHFCSLTYHCFLKAVGRHRLLKGMSVEPYRDEGWFSSCCLDISHMKSRALGYIKKTFFTFPSINPHKKK